MKYSLVILFFLSTLFFSCASKSSKDFAGNGELAKEQFESPPVEEQPPEVQKPIAESAIKPKLIKTGSVNFEVEDVGKTKDRVAALVKEFKAYVSKESVNGFSSSVVYTQEIRVPVNSFDDFVNKVLEEADKVASKNIQVQDVTAEYIDVEGRIKNKKELERTYTELLSKAKTVEEVLSIDKEIANVREEVESMEGRLKYLGDQTSFSTITLSYYEENTVSDSWGDKFGDAFGNGWNGFVLFFVGLVHLWPFIVFGIIIFIVVRRIIKNKKNKVAKS